MSLNLTYEVKGNGYVIYNNGKPWIVQDSYIPYPADTLAESAELHIQEIIKANTLVEQEPGSDTPTMEELQEKIADLQNQITGLQEQNKTLQDTIDMLVISTLEG